MAGVDLPSRIRRAVHLNDPLLLQAIFQNQRRDLHNPDALDGGNTSLHLAARLGHLEAVKYLVAAGHEDHAVSRNARLETPLHVALATRPVSTDAIVLFLAHRFPQSLHLRDRDGTNAIMLCAQRPPRANPPLLATLLALADRTILQATDAKGNTALHYASSYGETQNIKVLLDVGADPSAVNLLNWTPVAYSATVQVEVFFRNLTNSRSRSDSAGTRARSRSRGASVGKSAAPGSVRLVPDMPLVPHAPVL